MTAPQRNESVPSKLLQKVTSMLRDDFTLPTGDVLFFIRALHKSLEPQLAQAPQCESFNWHVPPPRGGVPLARVYADGSRLFAEHRYCGLAARQGWAFVIVGDDGRVLASASGNTPWWAEGIHAAELWALLNASQNAFPGSSFFVDCESVQIGSKNWTAWAHSPCRTFGRAWIPLSNAVEDYPESVGWMPAHCGKDAIGTLRLSNGEALSAVDLESNDLVDTLAKAAARSSPPSRSELELIVSTSKLVEDVATWIARIAVLANHFRVYVKMGPSTLFVTPMPRHARPNLHVLPVVRASANLGMCPPVLTAYLVCYACLVSNHRKLSELAILQRRLCTPTSFLLALGLVSALRSNAGASPTKILWTGGMRLSTRTGGRVVT